MTIVYTLLALFVVVVASVTFYYIGKGIGYDNGLADGYDSFKKTEQKREDDEDDDLRREANEIGRQL